MAVKDVQMMTGISEIFGILPISKELVLLVVSFLSGVLMIACYTFYSWLITKVIKTRCLKRTLCFSVADIIFWIAAAFFVFLMYYHIDNGAVRLFYYVFILCGMILAYNLKLHIIRRRNRL